MSIRATIIRRLKETRGASKKAALPLIDDLVLLESGLNSLGLAILVTRLEASLGVDPFTDNEITVPPVNLGEFILRSEHAANFRYVHSGKAQCADRSRCRQEQLLAHFPSAIQAAGMKSTWRPDGVQLYRNSLQYLAEQKSKALDCRQPRINYNFQTTGTAGPAYLAPKAEVRQAGTDGAL